jgi:glutathione S-transferase
MLKIYGVKTSSNVQKVLWCCGELGLAFQREEIGGAFGNNRSPAYLALNPNGLVPTIDEDGFILWESNVIVRYLSAKYGTGTLYPADLRQRADTERWMDWQQTALVPHMGILFRTMLRQPPDKIPEEQVRAAVQKAGDNWRILNARLSDRPFVGGAALTMGDIALGNAVHRWFKLPIDRPDLPQLKRWYELLCERPAYREHIASV